MLWQIQGPLLPVLGLCNSLSALQTQTHGFGTKAGKGSDSYNIYFACQMTACSDVLFFFLSFFFVFSVRWMFGILTSPSSVLAALWLFISPLLNNMNHANGWLNDATSICGCINKQVCNAGVVVTDWKPLRRIQFGGLHKKPKWMFSAFKKKRMKAGIGTNSPYGKNLATKVKSTV